MKYIDLTGQKFGRLTAIKKHTSRINGRSIVSWICNCDCGGESNVTANNLTRGKSKSCGCLAKETAVEHGRNNNLKHGQNKKGKATSEYRAWHSMIQRCENPKARGYEDYGGRGIEVCSEWRNSFEKFFADMGLKSDKSYSLDRKDANKGYSKDNCRWASKTEQSRNVRASKTNVTCIKGVQKVGDKKYKATIGVSGKSIFLGYFEDTETARKARKEAEEKLWR